MIAVLLTEEIRAVVIKLPSVQISLILYAQSQLQYC